MRLYSSFAKVIKISELGIYIDFSVFFFKQERHVNSPEDLEDEAIVEGLMQLMHVFWSCVMMKTEVTIKLYTFVVKFGPCTRFITLRLELIVIHFYVQKFGIKIFLSQHVCKIKTRTFCYFMKSPFITVSLSHSLSLRIVLLMQQYQEGKRCKVQFYHLYFRSFIRMSTFFCNKALSPYNNIPFHVLLLLIAAKAFFSGNAFHTLNFSF